MKKLILCLMIAGLLSCASHDVFGNKYKCPQGTSDPRCATRKPVQRDCVRIYEDGRLVGCVDRSEIHRVLQDIIR